MILGCRGFKSPTGLMHIICHEEVLAILAAFPFLAVTLRKVRAWFHSRKTCSHDTVDRVVCGTCNGKGAYRHCPQEGCVDGKICV